jgi:Kef-type K+ transport system membrane component KefB/nucleotide-binding universal stress UspA family protein
LTSSLGAFLQYSLRLGATAAVVLLDARAAWAQGGAAGNAEVVFLLQLVVLMLVGRLLGEAMYRLKQPSIMGQLFAGILLGPSLLGWVWPDLQHSIFPDSKEQRAMLEAISQFGILLLLLLSGMEINLQVVRKVGRAAIGVSLFGVAVPLACGFALGMLLPEGILPDADKRLITALFLGTALSISSIKIVSAIVRELDLARRNLGQIIIASAIIEDTLGWIIIAITFGIAQAGTIDLASITKSLIGTALFLAASFTVGRRAVFHLIRWSNDNFESEFPVITTILVIMGGMALTTWLIGVNTVLGAFISGVLIGESPILTRHIDEQLRGLIAAFFMPIFFGMAGLRADLTALKDPALLLIALVVIAVASIGKFGGAFLGGKIGGLTPREALVLGCGMNARGSTEVIVASIGLSMGALSQNLFTIIVAMAVVTTMVMPPMLRRAARDVPLRKSERRRLAREESEAESFVWNIERLLLVVDDSRNGKFAARLAGLLASECGLPVTVLPLPGERREQAREPATDMVTSLDAAVNQPGDGHKMSDKALPDVQVRTVDVPIEEAVQSEGRKGYDLLFVGVPEPKGRGGAFEESVSRISAMFPAPLAIAAARGTHHERPEHGALRILVPVNGTEVARRAAELAIAIARRQEASITVLYVSNRKSARGAGTRVGRRLDQFEQAVLDDVVDLAAQHDCKIKTAVRADIAPAQAILGEAKRGGRNIIFMGVSRRPGDKLFFGDTAAAVFERAPISILFLSD